jgi:DNA-directed RNA polymerase specialized sigma24 family protein
VLTIMRRRLLDMAKRTRDAMESAKCVPPEELSEWAYSDARAEQICFAKEALGLAGAGLSEEQASVFWPTLAGATLKESAVLAGVPKGTMATRLYRARSFMRRACAA